MSPTKAFYSSEIYDTNHLRLSQLDFVLYGFFHQVVNQNWHFTDILIPFPDIYLIVDGNGSFFQDGKWQSFIPGRAYFLPINVPMTFKCNSRLEKLWCYFSLELFPGQDITDGIDKIIDLGEYNLGCSKQDFIERLKRSSLVDLIYFQGVVFQLLARMQPILEKMISHNVQKNSTHEELLQYINEHLSANLRVSELAEWSGTSLPSLSRAFKRDIGCSLKDYLQNKLNIKTQSLLAGTDLKVKEVAKRLGYDDEYYFIRVFSRRNQLSPTKYRQKIQTVSIDN